MSSEELAYLLGLFLADGCRRTRVNRRGSREFFVKFTLQGDEEELAWRVVGLLRRIGLNPSVECPRQSWALIVKVWSRTLYEFLPNKELLLADDCCRQRFFDEFGLREARCSVPFVGGLLDGDGSCVVRVVRTRHGIRLGGVWNWSLVQSRYAFLAEYVYQFVGRLEGARRCVSVWRSGDKRGTHVFILKGGASALLEAGIGWYSWKVARWFRRIVEIRSMRHDLVTTTEAAKSVGVGYWTMYRWVRAGKVRCVRGSACCRSYIPVGEVQRLKQEVNGSDQGEAREKGSMWECDASPTLDLSHWRDKRDHSRRSEQRRSEQDT